VPVLVTVGILGDVGFVIGLSSYVRGAQVRARTEAATAATARPPGAAAAESQAAAVDAAARALIDDLAADRRDEAYDRMAPAYRAGVPRDRFVAASSAALRGPLRLELVRTRLTGDAGRAEGTLTGPAGAFDAVVHVARDGDRWAITGLTLGGAPALPGP
jgi:hypothetical protein